MFHEVSVCYHSETAFDCGERGRLSQVSTSSGHCRHTSAQHKKARVQPRCWLKSPKRRKIPLQQRPPKKWKSLWRMLYIYVYHYIYIIIYIYIYLCVSWYIIYIYIYLYQISKKPLAPYKAGPWSLAGIRIPYFDVVVGRASTATYAGWRAVSFGALAAMAGWNPGRKGKTWKNDLKPWVN